jgi:hypothetical protein
VLTLIFDSCYNSFITIGKEVEMEKLKLLLILAILSLATTGFCLDKPTKTYYNNKVSYKSLFGIYTHDLQKIQVIDKKGRRVQAEIPVAKEDVTQEPKKGK